MGRTEYFKHSIYISGREFAIVIVTDINSYFSINSRRFFDLTTAAAMAVVNSTPPITSHSHKPIYIPSFTEVADIVFFPEPSAGAPATTLLSRSRINPHMRHCSYHPYSSRSTKTTPLHLVQFLKLDILYHPQHSCLSHCR